MTFNYLMLVQRSEWLAYVQYSLSPGTGTDNISLFEYTCGKILMLEKKCNRLETGAESQLQEKQIPKLKG